MLSDVKDTHPNVATCQWGSWQWHRELCRGLDSGSAVRCKTLLGLRQQLWAGLLQIILAVRHRSRRLMWSPALHFRFALATFFCRPSKLHFCSDRSGILCSGEGCEGIMCYFITIISCKQVSSTVTGQSCGFFFIHRKFQCLELFPSSLFSLKEHSVGSYVLYIFKFGKRRFLFLEFLLQSKQSVTACVT